MLLGRNVHEFKIKKENRSDPSINGVVRMKHRIVEHPFYELSIHLDDELLDSDSVELSCLQSREETIELELRLGIARFLVVEHDRAKMTWVSLLISTQLQENEANAIHTRINSEDDWMSRPIVEGS